jgi:hypothetical protein
MGYIRCACDRIIMERDQDTVSGTLHIELEIVRAKFPRHQKGSAGFFRSQIGGTAMSDDRRPWNTHGLRESLSLG